MHCEPMIAVADVAASARWYVELLGADNDHGRVDFDRIVADGRVLLMLHRLEGAEHGLAVDVTSPIGNGVLLWVFVADLDTVYERARAIAATVVVEPHRSPQAGWREFTVQDPDGYRIAIAAWE
ncbi:MAG: VOC family protein [Pseudomonadota bacterium]